MPYHQISSTSLHPSGSTSLPTSAKKKPRLSNGPPSLSSSQELPPKPSGSSHIQSSSSSRYRSQATGGEMSYNEKNEEWASGSHSKGDAYARESGVGTSSSASLPQQLRKRNGSVLSNGSSTAYTTFSSFNSSNETATSSWASSMPSPLGVGRLKTDPETAAALGTNVKPTPPPVGSTAGEKKGRLSRQSSNQGMGKGGSSVEIPFGGSSQSGGHGIASFSQDRSLMAYPIVSNGGEEEMLKLGLGMQKELRAGGESLVPVDLSIMPDYPPVSLSRPPSGGRLRTNSGLGGSVGVGMQITPPEDDKGRRSTSANRRRGSTSGGGTGSGNNSGRNSRDLESRGSRDLESRRGSGDRGSRDLDGKGDAMDVDVKVEMSEKKMEEEKVKAIPRVKIDKDTFVDGLVSTTVIAINSIWPNQEEERSKGDENVLPLRWFIKEVLRRSRTTCSVLQTALYYLHKSRKAIRIHINKADDAERLLTKHAENLRKAKEGTFPPSPPPSPPRSEPVLTVDGITLPLTNDNVSQLLQLQTDPVLCGRRMFLAALICASKFLQDRNYSNRAWAKISGLEVGEINSNERSFLVLIEYRLHVDAPVFANWTDRLMKLAQFQSQKKPPASSSSSKPSPPQSIDRTQSEYVNDSTSSTQNQLPSRIATPNKNLRGTSDVTSGAIASGTMRTSVSKPPSKAMGLTGHRVLAGHESSNSHQFSASPKEESYPSPTQVRNADATRRRTNSLGGSSHPQPVAPQSTSKPSVRPRQMSISRGKSGFMSSSNHQSSNSIATSHPYAQAKASPVMMDIDGNGNEPWNSGSGWNGNRGGGITAH